MKSIILRNVPDDVYETLKTMSMHNHRSLQEQIKYILEREVKEDLIFLSKTICVS